MVEHNPAPSADNTHPPVIPLPIALWSPVNSFLSSMTEDTPAAEFRSVGRGSFQGRRASQRQPLQSSPTG